jgi:hypothetical protein
MLTLASSTQRALIGDTDAHDIFWVLHPAGILHDMFGVYLLVMGVVLHWLNLPQGTST